VLDARQWRLLARSQIRSKQRRRFDELSSGIAGIVQWSQATFPRRRKDLNSILRRLEIELDPSLAGLDREAAAICKIASIIDQGQRDFTQIATPRGVEGAPIGKSDGWLDRAKRMFRIWR
jgi:hypothetical protein